MFMVKILLANLMGRLLSNFLSLEQDLFPKRPSKSHGLKSSSKSFFGGGAYTVNVTVETLVLNKNFPSIKLGKLGK